MLFNLIREEAGYEQTHSHEKTFEKTVSDSISSKLVPSENEESDSEVALGDEKTAICNKRLSVSIASKGTPNNASEHPSSSGNQASKETDEGSEEFCREHPQASEVTTEVGNNQTHIHDETSEETFEKTVSDPVSSKFVPSENEEPESEVTPEDENTAISNKRPSGYIASKGTPNNASEHPSSSGNQASKETDEGSEEFCSRNPQAFEVTTDAQYDQTHINNETSEETFEKAASDPVSSKLVPSENEEPESEATPGDEKTAISNKRPSVSIAFKGTPNNASEHPSSSGNQASKETNEFGSEEFSSRDPQASEVTTEAGYDQTHIHDETSEVTLEKTVSNPVSSKLVPSENEEPKSEVTPGDEKSVISNKRPSVSIASKRTPNNVSEHPSSCGNQSCKETDEASEEFCSRDPQASEVTTEVGNDQTHINDETSEETFENAVSDPVSSKLVPSENEEPESEATHRHEKTAISNRRLSGSIASKGTPNNASEHPSSSGNQESKETDEGSEEFCSRDQSPQAFEVTTEVENDQTHTHDETSEETFENAVSDPVSSKLVPSENEEPESEATHRHEKTAISIKRPSVSIASERTPNNVSEHSSSSGNQVSKETDEGSEEFCREQPQASEVTTEVGNNQTHIHDETSEETFENALSDPVSSKLVPSENEEPESEGTPRDEKTAISNKRPSVSIVSKGTTSNTSEHPSSSGNRESKETDEFGSEEFCSRDPQAYEVATEVENDQTHIHDETSTFEKTVSDSVSSKLVPSENEEPESEATPGDENTAISNKRPSVFIASNETPNNASEHPSSCGNQASNETDEGSEEFCSRDPQASEVTTEVGNDQTHINDETSEETFENAVSDPVSSKLVPSENEEPESEATHRHEKTAISNRRLSGSIASKGTPDNASEHPSSSGNQESKETDEGSEEFCSRDQSPQAFEVTTEVGYDQTHIQFHDETSEETFSEKTVSDFVSKLVPSENEVLSEESDSEVTPNGDEKTATSNTVRPLSKAMLMILPMSCGYVHEDKKM